MAYFNPFLPTPMQSMVSNQQTPKIDPVQFRQFAMTLNDNALSQLADMAKQRGISDSDI
jgi:hypothetical protein